MGTDMGRPDGRPADYYVVMVARGLAQEPSRRRPEPAGWDEHAAFTDALAVEGFVVLGGPLGDVDDENALLIRRRPRSGPMSARQPIRLVCFAAGTARQSKPNFGIPLS
jgi:hypothetical protein